VVDAMESATSPLPAANAPSEAPPAPPAPLPGVLHTHAALTHFGLWYLGVRLGLVIAWRRGRVRRGPSGATDGDEDKPPRTSWITFLVVPLLALLVVLIGDTVDGQGDVIRAAEVCAATMLSAMVTGWYVGTSFFRRPSEGFIRRYLESGMFYYLVLIPLLVCVLSIASPVPSYSTPVMLQALLLGVGRLLAPITHRVFDLVSGDRSADGSLVPVGSLSSVSAASSHDSSFGTSSESSSSGFSSSSSSDGGGGSFGGGGASDSW
jgi:uncharacterized membrane protein YgcG